MVHYHGILRRFLENKLDAFWGRRFDVGLSSRWDLGFRSGNLRVV